MDIRKKNLLLAACIAGIALALYLYSLYRALFSSSEP